MKVIIKVAYLVFALMPIVFLSTCAMAIDADVASQVSKGINEWRLMNSGSAENKTEVKTDIATKSDYRTIADLKGQPRPAMTEGVLALTVDGSAEEWEQKNLDNLIRLVPQVSEGFKSPPSNHPLLTYPLRKLQDSFDNVYFVKNTSFPTVSKFYGYTDPANNSRTLMVIYNPLNFNQHYVTPPVVTGHEAEEVVAAVEGYQGNPNHHRTFIRDGVPMNTINIFPPAHAKAIGAEQDLFYNVKKFDKLDYAGQRSMMMDEAFKYAEWKQARALTAPSTINQPGGSFGSFSSSFKSSELVGSSLSSGTKMAKFSKIDAPAFTTSQKMTIDKWRNSSEPFYKFAGPAAMSSVDKNTSMLFSDPNAGLASSILIDHSNARFYNQGMREIKNNIIGAKEYLNVEKKFLSGFAIPHAAQTSANTAKIVLGYDLASAPLSAYGLTKTALGSASTFSKVTNMGADIAVDQGMGYGVRRFAESQLDRKIWQPINQRIDGMNWITETYIPSQQKKLADFTANRNYYRDRLISQELDAVEIIRSGKDTTGSLRAALSSTGPISNDLMNAKTTGSLFGKQPVMATSPVFSTSKIPEISKFTAPTYTISQTNLNKWRTSSEPFYKFATINSPIIHTSYSLPSTFSSSLSNSYMTSGQLGNISKIGQTGLFNSSGFGNSWNMNAMNSYGSSFNTFGMYKSINATPWASKYSTPSSFSNILSPKISTSYGTGSSSGTSYGSPFSSLSSKYSFGNSAFSDY